MPFKEAAVHHFGNVQFCKPSGRLEVLDDVESALPYLLWQFRVQEFHLLQEVVHSRSSGLTPRWPLFVMCLHETREIVWWILLLVLTARPVSLPITWQVQSKDR